MSELVQFPEPPPIPTSLIVARRLKRLAFLAFLFVLGIAAAKTRAHWWPYARVPLLRLQAELRIVFMGAEKQLAQAQTDPAAGHSAANLSTPQGPARTQLQRQTPTGQPKAPMLREGGIAMGDEMRPAIGGPVLLNEAPEPEWKRQAGPLIGICLGLIAFMGAFGYWKGSGRNKTLN